MLNFSQFRNNNFVSLRNFEIERYECKSLKKSL